ncbi:MAG: M55 family metallopeptidase [Fimbriimonadaceae bacterium]
MKVYISADIEGVTGVVTWGQCGAPNSDHYDWAFARRMMTHDVNAAIRGARAGGATEIVVKDSHNVSLNLLIDELEPGVELISGSRPGPDGMMEGIDKSFDCCFLVGYHGMAGTREGVMEHTISGRVHRLWVNEVERGEMGLSAFAAGWHGVPLVFVSSDDKGVAEAVELVEGVETVTTKFGMGRYMARLRHPSVTGAEIEAGAQRAVRLGLVPKDAPGPQVVRLELNRSEEIDLSSQLPGWKRLDAYTIEQKFSDWAAAHVGIRRAISFAG